MDAERAHRVAFRWGKLAQNLSLTPVRWLYGRGLSEQISQELFGLKFPGPLSIAAGLDKNGELPRLWQAMASGFVEIGSISAKASKGNPKPRAFRIVDQEAIINRMGLNNDGAQVIVDRLRGIKPKLSIPLGINVVKTHDPSILGAAGIDDICTSFRLAATVADYITINISCPNTAEGKTFEDPPILEALLEAIDDVDSQVPYLIKVSPDNDESKLSELVNVALSHNVRGFVATNTTGTRVGLEQRQDVQAIGKGGLSGRPLSHIAPRTVARLYTLSNGRLPIIGVGGISSANDAYKMIEAGASLLQIYTGLVYQGPSLFKRINKGIRRRLKRDGLSHISQAVGSQAEMFL